jgi:hypothetical protein
MPNEVVSVIHAQEHPFGAEEEHRPQGVTATEHGGKSQGNSAKGVWLCRVRPHIEQPLHTLQRVLAAACSLSAQEAT